MKKTLVMATILTGLMFLSTGCVSMQTGNSGNSKIADMDSAEAYVVGTTTLESVQDEIGATQLIFEKEDGATKYVWQSEEGSVSAFGLPFVGGVNHETDRHTLALTFDAKNILIAKSFKTGDYQDPDVAKMHNQLMKNFIGN
jgi:hypothetical protein